MEMARFTGCFEGSPTYDKVELVFDDREERNSSASVFPIIKRTVQTKFGPLTVFVQGNQSLPAVITYHDVGLNYRSCFQGFFNFCGEDSIWSRLCVYHVNAPCQEEEAPQLSARDIFPSCEQLSEQLEDVCQTFGIKHFFGLGVGTGGRIFLQYAAKHPVAVRGLIIVGSTGRSGGWFAWARGLLDSYLISYGGNAGGFRWEVVREKLMARYFSQKTMEFNFDLVQYHRSLLDSMCPQNVVRFLQSEVSQGDLSTLLKSVQCKVFLILGRDSPLYAESLHMFSCLPAGYGHALLELFDCGILATEEQPEALVKPMTLFFNGYGIF